MFISSRELCVYILRSATLCPSDASYSRITNAERNELISEQPCVGENSESAPLIKKKSFDSLNSKLKDSYFNSSG